VATIGLIVATVLVYGLVQHGALGLGVNGDIAFRCHAVEYGFIPYEATHSGAQLTDPYCQPQAEVEPLPGQQADEGAVHDHPRTDPGLIADAPTWLTPLTATFMHGALLHLGAAMLFLWIFGGALERRLGPLRLLGVYLSSGLVAAATLVVLAPDLTIATIGASGAVAGVLAGCARLLPRARVTMFELPMPLVAGVAVAAQAILAHVDAAQPVAGMGGDIAYLAPAGGLAAGALLVSAFAGRSRRRTPLPLAGGSHAQPHRRPDRPLT